MSRMSSAPSQRNLTLTEELEKLEQSITLTLQEIDHNFNRAHRIVTSSILPVVEQYAEHSKNVWEGTKFWKQFFEASANVSLNGYEETATEDGDATLSTEVTEEQEGGSSSCTSPPSNNPVDFSTPPSGNKYRNFGTHATPSDFDSPDFMTPRQKQSVYDEEETPVANYASPYEALRREVRGGKNKAEQETPASDLPSTPRAQTMSEDIIESSPIDPPTTARNNKVPSQDVLLHRILDKNYRIQATPHAAPKLPKPSTVTRGLKTPNTTRKGYTTALDLDSSPLEEAPQLHLDYNSPAKSRRKPGVSVLTPGKPSARKVGKTPEAAKGKASAVWDSDSDDEFDGLPEGMRPPKTIQFHVPQSKLLQTPAQEASKRIMDDLLATAGGNTTDDFSEDSPSVIKRGRALEDDTF